MYKPQPKIALFDLDGVLIKPGGYRAAFLDTFRYFLNQMGCDALLPDVNIMSLFEAFSVSSEWDMLAISFAILLETACEQTSGCHHLDDWNSAVEWMRTLPQKPNLDFNFRLRSLHYAFDRSDLPPLRLLQNCRNTTSRSPLPHLSVQPVLEQILGTTRQMLNSPFIPVFQNYILGNEVFENIYQYPAPFKSPSYLKTFDHLLIDQPAMQTLDGKFQSGEILPAVITARTSLPPREASQFNNGWGPEAELALELLNWSPYPLIAYGRLIHLAEGTTLTADSLLKPAPLQALAGIAAACTQSELPALNWALHVCHPEVVDGKHPFPLQVEDCLRSFAQMDVHIFEDSPIGIQAARKAVQIMSGKGFHVNLHLWGMSPDPDKQASLRAAGAILVEDIHEALWKAFNIKPGLKPTALFKK